MSKHECAAPGCHAQIPPHLVMCQRHWFMLPRGTRQAINDVYQRGPTGGRSTDPRFLALVQDAAAWLAEHEGPAT